jgi:hypothetical protein
VGFDVRIDCRVRQHQEVKLLSAPLNARIKIYHHYRNEEVTRREAAGPEDRAPRQPNTKIEPLCSIAAARVEET